MNLEQLRSAIAREYGTHGPIDIDAFIAKSVQKIEAAMDSARDLFIADMLTTGVGCFVTKHEDGEVKQTRLDPQDLTTKEIYPFSK